MKRSTLWLAATAAVIGAAPAMAADNPFATRSTLPFEAPPFDRITDADYQPGFEQGMAEQRAEMRRIADDPAPPSFANTIAAMERSGAILRRVSAAFGAVNQADTNPARQAVQKAMAPKLAAHNDAIYLDPALFARVKRLYDQRASLGLDAQQRQVLDIVYQRFVRAGALLSDADKAKLRDLNGQLSMLQTAFVQKLLAATKAGALVVDDPAALAGLGDGGIAAAAAAANQRGLSGKWVVPLQNTTQQPALESLSDRATRARLFDRSWTRSERGDANDTRDTAATIAQLRARKAALLGYPDWASYVLADQMAKTPQTAEAFMAKLIPPTVAQQRREAAEIDAAIKADGGDFTVKPWDWDRYAERVRHARFDLDQNQVKPYFELNAVLEKGVFFAATKLYGVTFKARHDIPVYNPDVRVFEVFDRDGKHLGLFYCDYFKRDNKQGGAWMSSFVGQSGLLGTQPVVYNVANLPKPAAGQPALISFDDVTTMFHEFGHALHGLFSNIAYPSLGASARDFVEFPSQFNEHWALDPAVLAHYAVDYRTGAPMPAPLVAKIKQAAKFNQGYALGELIAAAELDMQWHALPATAPKQDVNAFETAALAKTGLDVANVPPRYRSSYFQHIWSGGYAAGYYGYLWTQMLENDAYAWFMAHGGLTRANGDRFRDLVLSRGHSQDYATMFRAFYGKDPDISPMLQDRGLVPAAKP
ncbi:M3 family metallopeptidase [Sphingomonas sp. CROZ-RG-20F-R02-07]|uniref:M3 family metallopeptidase n=1 Tax=Sphingomonas sp. CROZ-RG-20F-R02-07 TaxID=2914832 RepID=UPI001F5A0D42|nr:M3 family metallopeptidase [Sphingomonas sp. CROZ-RG-20F-R02-07]